MYTTAVEEPPLYAPRGRRPLDQRWNAELIRRLRAHLNLSQREFAAELNARQQTVSEWETGRYRPRGPSARLLTMIAEGAGFAYGSDPRRPGEDDARSPEDASSPEADGAGPGADPA